MKVEEDKVFKCTNCNARDKVSIIVLIPGVYSGLIMLVMSF